MKTWIMSVIFILAGALLGFFYYRFFGCSGSCPITSSPWMTMVYFGLMGGVLSMGFVPGKKK